MLLVQVDLSFGNLQLEVYLQLGCLLVVLYLLLILQELLLHPLNLEGRLHIHLLQFQLVLFCLVAGLLLFPSDSLRV